MVFSVSASLFSRYLSLAWAYSTQFIQSKSLTSSSVGALSIGAFVVLASIVCCLGLTTLRVAVVFVGAVVGFCAIFSSPNSTTMSTSVQISFDDHELSVAWHPPYYPIESSNPFNQVFLSFNNCSACKIECLIIACRVSLPLGQAIS